MAIRKQFLGAAAPDPELVALMKERRKRQVTEEELRQQRVSFAFGNAMNAEGVTKESVRTASNSLRLRA
jgi:hypothetical protein